MRTGLSQHTGLRQELRINPRLYQAMDMLYMPMMDLQQHLKQELLVNPFLELLEPEEEEQEQKEPTAEQEKERLATLKNSDGLKIVGTLTLQAICINRETGSIEQTIDLFDVTEPEPKHALNSYASPTPVIAGDKIFCHFGTYGTAAINRGWWQNPAGVYSDTRYLTPRGSIGASLPWFLVRANTRFAPYTVLGSEFAVLVQVRILGSRF